MKNIFIQICCNLYFPTEISKQKGLLLSKYYSHLPYIKVQRKFFDSLFNITNHPSLSISSMASSSSNVDALSNNLQRNRNTSKRNNKHVSLQGKGRVVDSFALIRYVRRESEVTGNVVSYAIKKRWGAEREVVIISTGRRNVFIYNSLKRNISKSVEREATCSWCAFVSLTSLTVSYECSESYFSV